MLYAGFVYSARVPGYIRDYKRVFYQGSTGEMDTHSQATDVQQARPKSQLPEHESESFEPPPLGTCILEQITVGPRSFLAERSPLNHCKVL